MVEYKMAKMWHDETWRNDANVKAITGEINYCSSDTIIAENDHSVIIRHIIDATGQKAFMPVVKLPQGTRTGKIFPGSNSIPYILAIANGKLMLRRLKKINSEQ